MFIFPKILRLKKYFKLVFSSFFLMPSLKDIIFFKVLAIREQTKECKEFFPNF